MYTKAYYNGVLVNDLQYQYSSILNKFDVASIYENGEKGFWFDPNDLSTMYQDAAGTNPVTGVGQPVGLLLDKSNGLIRGAELWKHSSALTVGESSVESTNTYRIKSTDGSSSYAYCSGFSSSKFYEVSFDIVSITGSISTDVEAAPVWSTVGRKKFIGKPLGGWLTIKRSGVCDAVVANISVKEIAGNHAYQTVSASRPVLKNNVNVFSNTRLISASSTPIGWINTGAHSAIPLTIVNNAGALPNHNAVRVTRVAGTTGLIGFQHTVLFSVGKKFRLSFYARKVIGSAAAAIYIYWGNGRTVDSDVSSTLLLVPASSLSEQWVRYSFDFTVTTAITQVAFVLNTGSVDSCFEISSPDARYIDEGINTGLPAYQDILEGVGVTQGFPNYLYFDGVDDFLQTNNIDFTTTDKVSVFAGVRKLSDSTSALCVGFGDGTSSTVNAFALYAPAGFGANKYDMRNTVTAVGANTQDIRFNAPHSAVLTGTVTPNKVDKASLRVNGEAAITTQTGRGGNLVAAPLYIGRRSDTQLPFTGHIYGLIGIGKLTTDNETINIEKMLAKKIGVVLNV